jgi:hypothetical protein
VGVALYPDFEHDVPGYNPTTSISGKALAAAVYEGGLEAVCHKLGVTPLLDFYSETKAEGFEKIGEAIPPDWAPEKPQWFEPAVGLHTVDALLGYPEAENMEPRLLDDVRQLQKILSVALEHGTRFRLRIDI